MSNKEFKLPKAKCKRCGYEWTPRNAVVTLCARCKSPYWDKPKKEDDDTLARSSIKLPVE